MVTLEEKIEDAPEGKFFRAYWRFLSSNFGKYFIILWWFCILLLGIFYGFKFLTLTVFEFSAPSGSDGDIAQTQYNLYFSSQSNLRQLVILYQCNKCNNTQSIKTKQYPYSIQNNLIFKNISLNLNLSLYQYSIQHDNIVYKYNDYFNAMQYTKDDGGKAQVFQNYVATAAFVNGEMNNAIGVVQYENGAEQKTKDDLIDWLYDTTIDLSHDGISVSMTGQSALIKAMNEESKKDVEKKDVITIPIALCVLAIIVRSWRLMFIPILCFGISICTSFSIMRPFTSVLDVSPFTPSIMMSVSIAMSIDYSLFLLTRYREEVEHRIKGIYAISLERNIEIARIATKQTTRWSGKVVCLSGAILASTYLCLVAYPLSALQSMGLGASFAIVCTIWVNMTLTPALLLIFPVFFSQFGANSCGCCRKQKELSNGYHDGYHDLSDDNNHGHGPPHVATNLLSANSPATNPHERPDSISNAQNLEEEALKSNVIDRCWYFCGMKTTLWPFSLILCVVVYGLIAPVGWKVIDIQKQLQDTLIFPRDSPYLVTYNDVSNNFPPGLIAPWQILIPIIYDEYNIESSEFIDDTGNIMNNFWNMLNQNGYGSTIIGQAFLGVSGQNATVLSYDDITDIKNSSEKYSYEYIVSTKMNSELTAVYYQMTTSFDPYYKDAITFVANAREYLLNACSNNIPSNNTYNCYLLGGSVAEVDSVNKTFNSFPWVLAIIICAVFSVMGIVFQSCFVPFRLLVTIIVPMTFVYGFAIFVYQDGIFSGTNWDALANTDGLYWLVPVMTVTILVGLALDYDIFLFARIYEYRVMGGVPTRDAIVRGVFKTGSIITAAGIIMAIAFCGLMLSNITSLNQTGFILVVAVLVDTFVIRTSLVPAVLSMAGEVNWWPGLKTCGKPRRMTDGDYQLNSNQGNYGIAYDNNNNNNMPQPTLDETM